MHAPARAAHPPRIARIGAALARRRAWCGAQHLVDLVAAGHDRIERGHRLLEDHRHARAAQLAQPGRRAARTFSPSSRIWPAVGFSAFGSRPMTVKAITDLPEPDCPTRRDDLAGPTVKLTFDGDRGRRRGSGTVRSRTSRIRLLCVVHRPFLLILGSSVSRRPSPGC